MILKPFSRPMQFPLEVTGFRFLKEWNPVVTLEFIFGVPLLYVIFVLLLKRWMKDRPAYTLKWVLRIYDVAQVLICSYTFLGLIHIVSFPNIFAFGRPFDATVEYFVIIHYLSKILDMMDTVFIILKKNFRQLSLLHVYHHASIGPVWAMALFTGNGSGAASYGALINSFIHVVMYSHYFWVSFGFKNPYKKYVTKAQILQFLSCIFHGIMIAIGCDPYVDRVLGLMETTYHVTLTILFADYYRGEFKAKKKKGE